MRPARRTRRSASRSISSRRGGFEPAPPVSGPFRCFLSRLTCWATAQRHSLGAKIPRKLPAHRCSAVSAERIWAEARRSPQGILPYCQGLERSISPNLPAQTGAVSIPPRLKQVPFASGISPAEIPDFPGLCGPARAGKQLTACVEYGKILYQGGRLPLCRGRRGLRPSSFILLRKGIYYERI